jgi:hypothetical protein
LEEFSFRRNAAVYLESDQQFDALLSKKRVDIIPCMMCEKLAQVGDVERHVMFGASSF